jgi:imidazolonepropionase-like amidohydrolase
MSREVDGPEAVRKAAREAFRDGADFLKLFLSCDPVDVGNDELATVEFRTEELRAAVEEAHARRKRVAVHSVGTKAIGNALSAGVDSVEHGVYLNDELAEKMVKASVHLVPTVSGYREMSNPDWGWPPEFAQLYARLHDSHLVSLEVAVKAGVPLAVGSDSNGDMIDEIEWLIRGGLSTLQAISAATLGGAQVIGMAERIGSIEPGKLADFLILDKDPLASVEAMREIHAVVKGGRVLRPSELGVVKWKAAADSSCD